MSQTINGDGQERASQVPDIHFKICNLGPIGLFFPKPPYNVMTTTK